MTIPPFTNTTLTHTQLNVLVDALNNAEFTTRFPLPAFHGQILDAAENAGANAGAERSWRYLIIHQAGNTKLHCRYEWVNPADSPSTSIYVDSTQYAQSSSAGVHDVTITISGTAGQLITVRVYALRKQSDAFMLHWLYEDKV